MKDFRFYWEEKQDDKGHEIRIEMPGFSKDEIKVSIENNFISVAAEKKHRKTEKGRGFYREEAFQSSFRRSMSLPPGLSPDEVDVKVEDGLVRIKKKKKARV